MWHGVRFGEEFFAELLAIDAAMALATQARGCGRCGGPLCVGHYERKPRGGLACAAGESSAFTQRYSYCCSREGCRKRTTPPSVRFLGRRVYLEVAILLTCALVPLLEQTRRAVLEATGVAWRTVLRWQSWWRTVFTASAVWTEAHARVPLLAVEDLPGALIESFGASTAGDKLVLMARLLRPLTSATGSGSRFAREAA